MEGHASSWPNPGRSRRSATLHSRIFLSALCLLCVGSPPARAWGPDGHIIVARIAELRLTPEASKKIGALLNGEKSSGKAIRISDENFCNWADYVRRDRSETAPWHFVDIPFDAKSYDPVRDCANHQGCVVEAVRDFSRLIADPDTSQTERLEGLKFLVHFVGDMHQPLHCAERNGDRGGNECWVTFPGIAKAQKLHVVWDVHLVKKNMEFHRMDALAFAALLNSRITKEQEALWKQGSSADWAWESHMVAVTKTYATIPVGGGKILSHDYVETNQSVVDEQLKRGGVRLAELLNEAFK
jgi:hypothetical protein